MTIKRRKGVHHNPPWQAHRHTGSLLIQSLTRLYPMKGSNWSWSNWSRSNWSVMKIHHYFIFFLCWVQKLLPSLDLVFMNNNEPFQTGSLPYIHTYKHTHTHTHTELLVFVSLLKSFQTVSLSFYALILHCFILLNKIVTRHSTATLSMF